MRVVAMDTETGGLNWFDEDEQAFMCTWSWADEGHDHFVTIDDPTAADQIRAVLEEADVWVAHNAKFDIHQLYATWGIDVLEYDVEIHDTDLLSRVVQPTGSGKGMSQRHGLKHQASIHIDPNAAAEEEAIKEAGKSIGLKTLRKPLAYYKVWRAYPELMQAYAMKDTRYCAQLWAILMDLLDAHFEPRLRDVYALERQVVCELIRAERRGVTVDPLAVNKLRAKYRKEANSLRATLVAELGEAAIDKDAADETDGSMAENLREALLMLGVPLYKKTETGLLSTAKFALQEFEDEFPILSTLRAWRTASKFLATYVDPMVDRDVVHASFFQLGAWTSRMSCSRPNMQNVPKGEDGARSMFTPRPGYALLVADYSSIEAFLAAHYFGVEEYRALVAERDPHAWLVCMVDHGGDLSYLDQYLKGTPGQKRRDELKNVTYAILYGAGAPRIADMLQTSKPEASVLIKAVKAALPGYHLLNNRIKGKVKAKGFVQTGIGRISPVNKDKAYVGMSAVIQGTASEVMKQGLVATAREYRAHPEWDAHVLLIVHDELVSECKVEHADATLKATIDAMETAGSTYKPPIKSEGRWVTMNYGEAK